MMIVYVVLALFIVAVTAIADFSSFSMDEDTESLLYFYDDEYEENNAGMEQDEQAVREATGDSYGKQQNASDSSTTIPTDAINDGVLDDATVKKEVEGLIADIDIGDFL